MSNKQIFLVFVLLFLIFAIGTASASTITVGPTGDFTTIQAAVSSATNGDTILVSPGTYIENVNVNKEVKIMSQSGNPGDTIVKAANSEKHVFNVTANDVTIDGLNITGAKAPYIAGIFLDSIKGCTINNNILSHNEYGICLSSSSNNTLTGNTADNNSHYGIWLSSSSNNTLTSNTANNNSYYGICLSSSSNNTLTGNTVQKNTYNGIYLSSSSNNTLTSNTVQKNSGCGIYLNYMCNNNKLTSNKADNNAYYGIYLSSSSNNTLTSNKADNVRFGIYLAYSSNNTLTSNKADNNNYGIFLEASSNNNTLTSNTADNNGNYGIYLYNSNNNIIYNNYFNNTNNIYVKGTNNYWNITKTVGTNIVGGPYLGGNFWATPDGTGFSQTHADSDADGICDESYVMSSENIDHLPLAYPTSTPADWNPWNDPDSAGGESITLAELQTAIYDWRFGIVLSTGEMVDLSRLQGLIYSWRFG